MSKPITRTAAGVFAVCGIVVGPLIVVLEDGWRKTTAIPILYLSWKFAKYATRGDDSRDEGVSPFALYGALFAAFTLAIFLIIAGEKFGRWTRMVLVVGIVLLLVTTPLITYRYRARFVRDLIHCDRDTQDRILAQLDPIERAKILRALGRDRIDS